MRGGPEVNLTTSTTHAFISPPTLVPRDPKRAPLSPPQFTSATLPPSIIFHVSRRLRNREHRAMHGNIPTPPPNPNPPERPRLKRGAPLAPVRHTRRREGGIEGRGWGERGGPASGGGGGEGQATGEWDASNEDWPPLTPSSLPSPHLPPSSPGQGTRTPPPPPSSPPIQDTRADTGGPSGVGTGEEARRDRQASRPPSPTPSGPRVSTRTQGAFTPGSYVPQPQRYQTSAPPRRRATPRSGASATSSQSSQASRSLPSSQASSSHPSSQATQVNESSSQELTQTRPPTRKRSRKTREHPPEPLRTTPNIRCCLRDRSTQMGCPCVSHSFASALFHYLSPEG